MDERLLLIYLQFVRFPSATLLASFCTNMIMSFIGMYVRYTKDY